MSYLNDLAESLFNNYAHGPDASWETLCGAGRAPWIATATALRTAIDGSVIGSDMEEISERQALGDTAAQQGEPAHEWRHELVVFLPSAHRTIDRQEVIRNVDYVARNNGTLTVFGAKKTDGTRQLLAEFDAGRWEYFLWR